MMKLWEFVIATVMGLVIVGGIIEPVQAESPTIGASPSLHAAFDEIGPLFEHEYGSAVHMVYMPSKMLLHNIEQGALIDVFVSAGADKVESLHSKGLTRNAPRIFTETSLV